VDSDILKNGTLSAWVKKKENAQKKPGPESGGGKVVKEHMHREPGDLCDKPPTECGAGEGDTFQDHVGKKRNPG